MELGLLAPSTYQRFLRMRGAQFAESFEKLVDRGPARHRSDGTDQLNDWPQAQARRVDPRRALPMGK
jgi:hypothetical protein